MVIAALVSFGILLVAWILAPESPRTAAAAADAPLPEPQPLAA
jgi:hypothetical protein